MKFHLGSQDLLAGESSNLETQFPEVNVYFLGDKIDSCLDPCVFVQENLEPRQLISAVHQRNLRHVVQKNQGYFVASLAATARLIQSGQDYFKQEYCFSEEAVLSSVTLQFKGREDKKNLKTQSHHFLDGIKSASVSSAADAIIEELYMNAMLDAPREAQAKGIQVENPINEVQLSQTANWLQISCTDPYGSLAVKKLIARMDEVYSKGAGQAINMDNAEGAGLGCVILFEHCSCLIIGVQPGRKTKVTCLIALGVSNRRRAEMKKSLHWLEV